LRLFVARATIASGAIVIAVAMAGPAVYLEQIIDNALVVLEAEMVGAPSDLPG
jgi:hypothetical protein